MKKISLLIILFSISFSLALYSQSVAPSLFESNTGTYEEITGGTVIDISSYTGTELTNKAFISNTEGVSVLTTTEGFPIGFNLTFNSTLMNRFVISCYPQLILGKDEVKINPVRSGFLLDDDYAEGISNVVGVGVFSNISASDDTEISYKLTGTAPNRVMIVQWKNLSLSIDWGSNYKKVDAQIRLHETTNKVQLIFNNWASEGAMGKAIRVGIRGKEKTDANLRYSATNDFTNTVKLTQSIMSWSKNANIPDGLTYTFTPPAECETPVAQATDLQLTASSIGVSGSYTVSESADHYLVVMSTEPTLSQMPKDNTYYAEGDQLGNGTVICYTTESSFATPETLDGAKSYYFHVFATNSFCTFGPLYNTTTPLTGNIKTCPEAPTALSVTDVNYTTAKLSAGANAAGNEVIILATDVAALSEYGDLTENGDFAIPSGALSLGDELEINDEEGSRFGGRVVYMGPAKEGITVENLTEGVIWHFVAYSKVGEEYSTTHQLANVLTWAKVPYIPNFWDFPHYSSPFGWEVESDGGSAFYMLKVRDSSGGSYIQMQAKAGTAANAMNPVTNSLMTQYILLNENSNRLVLNCTFWEYVSRISSLPYNTWNENDFFDIEATKDGENFTLIKRFDKENAPQFQELKEMKDLYIPIEDLAGEKVKIRITWKCHANVSFECNYLRIEEITECDYPINVKVDKTSIVGTNAAIDWDSQGDETLWDIRYCVSGANEWTEVLNVSQKPYLLTTLPCESTVDVQVRAKCSEDSFSPWSPVVCTFKTGYGIPYSQTFAGWSMPVEWTTITGELADPTVFNTGSMVRSFWNVNDGLITQFNNSIDWAIFPKLEFGDGTYNHQLEFDLKVEGSVDNDEDILYVVMSQDGGLTFNTTDVIKEIALNDASLVDGEAHRQIIPINNASGVKQLAFYTGSGSQRSRITINELTVIESCLPAAQNGVATDISDNSATITWEGEAEEWMVFVRKAGETSRDYETQTSNEIQLTDLDDATTYEVGITHACDDSSIAKVSLVRFTTLAIEPCDPVEDITVATTIYTATISWTHSGVGFNVKHRRAGTESWTESKVDTPQLQILNLTNNTEYEYQIQAICSEAEGHVSDWTEVAKFKTLEITCFPPTNIQVAPTYKVAVVSWEGNADKYEINYRESAVQEWTTKEVTGTTYTIEELNPTTNYSLRMRSLCDSETSSWSAVVEFKTIAIPECVIPTNLKAEDITTNSAQLSWEGDDSNLSWNLRYREGSATSWNNVTELETESYEISNLKEDSYYIWTVRANCEENRQSAWAVQSNFTTEHVGIDGLNQVDVDVFAKGRIINVINTEGIVIDRIELFALNGTVLGVYNINSIDNILIPVAGENSGLIIVKVTGNNLNRNYKVMIK